MTTGQISDLYFQAYFEKDPPKIKEMMAQADGWITKRIVANFNVNVGDSIYYPGSYTAKNGNNSAIYKHYLYELTMPSGTSELAQGKKMVSDLDLFFNISSSIEKRKVRTLSLVKLKGYTTVPANTEKDMTYFDGVERINNGYISDYLQYINCEHRIYYTMTPLLIYDKTGIKEKVHLPLQLKFPMKLDDLRKQLLAYHLDIIPGEDKEMDMLVLVKKER